MSKYYVDGADLTSVADAIRTKGDTNLPLEFPSEFVQAINDIPTNYDPYNIDIDDGKTRILFRPINLSGYNGKADPTTVSASIGYTGSTVSTTYQVRVDFGDGTTETYTGRNKNINHIFANPYDLHVMVIDFPNGEASGNYIENIIAYLKSAAISICFGTQARLSASNSLSLAQDYWYSDIIIYCPFSSLNLTSYSGNIHKLKLYPKNTTHVGLQLNAIAEILDFKDGLIITANQYFMFGSGHSPDQILGKNIKIIPTYNGNFFSGFQRLYKFEPVIVSNASSTGLTTSFFSNGCYALRELRFGEYNGQWVRTFGNNSFSSARSLFTLILDVPGVITLTSAMSDNPIASGTGLIYVRDAQVENYKAATNWSQYANQIKPLSELPE